eukprot:scaffold37999_cov214-Skeletonema_marinoi.AAC.23
MDEATLAAEAAMNRRIILEQAIIIRSLLPDKRPPPPQSAEKEDGDKDIMKDFAKGMTLSNDQLADASTELLLTVLLLRLKDERAEGRAVVPSEAASSGDEQLMDDAVADKMKKKRAAAAAKKKEKKKRYKRNQAAAKQKKTKLMSLSWMGGGLISVIAMVVFGSIATVFVPLSLVHQTDGSGEGKAPPALPPSASKPLRQRNHRSNNDNAESTSPDGINHPLAAIVPPPIFSPTAASKSDELASASTCLDTPNWKDRLGDGCDWYEANFDPGCPYTDSRAGDMGFATEECCYCGGGSHTLPPTNSPTITNSPTKSAAPSSSSGPSSYHPTDPLPTSSLSISFNPTQLCLDTPNWKDKYGRGCFWYSSPMGCPYDDAERWAGDMGPATKE